MVRNVSSISHKFKFQRQAAEDGMAHTPGAETIERGTRQTFGEKSRALFFKKYQGGGNFCGPKDHALAVSHNMSLESVVVPLTSRQHIFHKRGSILLVLGPLMPKN